MALSRACSIGRFLVSRGVTTRAASPAFSSGRIANLYRPFASTSRSFQETTQDDVSGSSSSPVVAPQASTSEQLQQKNARSVRLVMKPRKYTSGAIEGMFKNAGLDIRHLHMNVDRFRFITDPYASVELADERQAQTAVRVLNGSNALGKRVYVNPLDKDYEWKVHQTRDSLNCLNDEASIRSAVQPLMENRRVRVSIKFPGWGSKGAANRREKSRAFIARIFDQYGLERISENAPLFGDKSYMPKFFCHVDLTTKKGAEEAIKTLHDTVVEDVRIWLRLTEVDAAKAYQIGQWSKTVLAELQEKGLAPPDSEIDEGLVTRKTKKDYKHFDRRRFYLTQKD